MNGDPRTGETDTVEPHEDRRGIRPSWVHLRDAVLEVLAGHEVIDLGTHDAVKIDYPDKAREVGQAIQSR